jgi:putative ABC transport system substrate-binding protein
MPFGQLKRRDFITLVSGAAAAWPLVTRAQQSDRVRLIGVLITISEREPELKAWLRAFQEELQRLGWEQGRNTRVEYRSGGNDQLRLRTDAAELVGMTPDVLFASGAPALVALNRETRSLPIVFVQVSDPVKLGFVTSLARPGGNVTGFANFEHPIGGKWLELLKDTAPGRSRVAVILDPENPSQIAYWEAIEAAAPSFGVQLTRAEVRDAAEIERAINAFAQQPNGALLVAPNAITILHRDLIIALAAQHRLPAVYPASGVLCRSHPEGHQAGRSASAAGEQVRAHCQSQDRESAWPHHRGAFPATRRRGDRVTRGLTPSIQNCASPNVSSWHSRNH